VLPLSLSRNDAARLQWELVSQPNLAALDHKPHVRACTDAVQWAPNEILHLHGSIQEMKWRLTLTSVEECRAGPWGKLSLGYPSPRVQPMTGASSDEQGLSGTSRNFLSVPTSGCQCSGETYYRRQFPGLDSWTWDLSDASSLLGRTFMGKAQLAHNKAECAPKR
jgi:hypothetical protein